MLVDVTRQEIYKSKIIKEYRGVRLSIHENHAYLMGPAYAHIEEGIVESFSLYEDMHDDHIHFGMQILRRIGQSDKYQKEMWIIKILAP
jgi:hypothetical protein